MKIAGKKLSEASKVNIVLPRTDGDIVLIAKGITSYKEFMDICPIPKPPVIKTPKGETKLDITDEAYVELRNKWAEKKTAWMIIKSLEDTPGLEWETVKSDDPDTYLNYLEELQNSGFTEAELNRIMDKILLANGINAEMIEEAEKRFLAGQVQGQ